MMTALLKEAVRSARLLAFGGLIALTTSMAYADSFSTTNDRPVTPDTDDLQELFEDELITANADNWDVEESQIGSAVYTSTGSGVSNVRIAHLGDNFAGTFGIFDALDKSKKIELFSSDDGAAEGDLAVLEFLEGGKIKKNLSTTFTGRSGEFSFFVEDAQGNIYYAADDLNDDDEAYAVVYRGDGEMVVKLPTVNSGTWSDNEYFIAFTNGDGDKTFTDIVVIMESIEPTPEPSTLVMLGAGMVALVAIRRRRRA